jgi:uncharacterized protein (DUF305 family)
MISRVTPDDQIDEEDVVAARAGGFGAGLRGFLPRSNSGWAILGIGAAIFIGVIVFAYEMIPRDPGTNSPEAGFLRDMQTHHTQAVTMAMAIRDRTTDTQLKALCTDIAFAQEQEIGKMQGYLDAWGLPFSGDRAPMAWMGAPLAAGQLMPGMATDEQVAELSTLPEPQAEVLFLQLMIRHHQGGVAMAQDVLKRTDNKIIKNYATTVIAVQNNEINTMNQMLIERGQKPITDPLPSDMNM